ncbi:MAG: hypothetical protein RLZZ312_1561 [Bacteroidota bacterium]|jgi:predicted enzyme related to lactoylglutathione lyase
MKKVFLLIIITAIFSCKKQDTDLVKAVSKSENPFGFVEIPVLDLQQSILFYENIFGYKFIIQKIDGNEMAFFPMDDTAKGISGALVFGKTYKPSITGTIVYINTKNIDKTNKLIVDNGGKIVYPKTSIGDMGFVAEFIDVAGNRVALHQDKNPK